MVHHPVGELQDHHLPIDEIQGFITYPDKWSLSQLSQKKEKKERCFDQDRMLLYLQHYKRCPCGTVLTKILIVSSPFSFLSL
jgi:hypothetical protein